MRKVDSHVDAMRIITGIDSLILVKFAALSVDHLKNLHRCIFFHILTLTHPPSHIS